MKYWVAVYERADKFLTDNGGKFVNEEFMTLCKALNIKVHTTGTESPWSNGRWRSRIWRGSAKVLGKDGQQVLVKHGGTYVRCHPCCLSLKQLNQHQQSSQPQTASSNNSDSDSDTNTLRITEPPRQRLAATNSNVTSSDSENEHTDNYQALKQNNHSKEIISDAEDLSLSLPTQLSFPQKKATNINKEPKKDMIMHLKTDKQGSWKQVKILSRVGKVVRANQENIRTTGMYQTTRVALE